MRNALKIAIPAALFVLGLALPAGAHHSFPATYDVNRTITVKGKVARFMFRNPHSLVQMEVIGDDKQVQQWTVEWAAAGALARGMEQLAGMGNDGRRRLGALGRARIQSEFSMTLARSRFEALYQSILVKEHG